MAADGSIVIEIRGDAKDIEKALEDLAGTAKKTGDKFSDVFKGSFFGGLAAKGVELAISAVKELGAAVVDIGKQAVSSYASYEQLSGGIETLFKDSSGIVEEYAANAYKTAGVSANTYMDTVTSFSASLISSLGGNTEKAAHMANQAIVDMADNANKMGTDMNTIIGTYQSLARGNYAMLDNLKLGYGGTQAELIRLINDSGVLEEKLTSLDGVGFDTIIEAIGAVQDQLGITGATAEEAASTVEGSANAMKAAWENWQAGLGNADADMQALTDALTESVNKYLNNLMPVITEVISNMITSIPSLIAGVADSLTVMLAESMVQGIDSVAQVLKSLAEVIPGALSGAASAVSEWATSTFGNLNSSASGFVSAFVGKFSEAGSEISSFVSDTISSISNWANNIVSRMSGAASNAVNAVQTFFSGLPGRIKGALASALSALISWGSQMASQARAKMVQVGNNIKSALSNLPGQMLSIGRNIIQGLINGISSMVGNVLAKVRSIASSIKGAFTSLLGIASPSKVFKQYGQWLIEGLVIGVEKREQAAASAVSSVANRVANEIERLNEEIKNIEDEAAKEALQSRKESLDALSKEYSDYVDDVLDEREKLEESLSSADLFIEDDEGGFQLRDLTEDIQAIKDYSTALDSLRSRGIDTALYSEILAMDMEEASNYANALLSLSDEAYADYIAAYQEKARLAAEVSRGIYEPLLDSAENAFNEKLPEDLRVAGEDSMTALAESIVENGEQAVSAASQIADAINAELSRINAGNALRQAGIQSAYGASGTIEKSVTNSTEGKRANTNADNGQLAAAVAMMMSSVSPEREIVLNINGKEAARALVPDIRAVEDQSPRIVSDN